MMDSIKTHIQTAIDSLKAEMEIAVAAALDKNYKEIIVPRHAELTESLNNLKAQLQEACAKEKRAIDEKYLKELENATNETQLAKQTFQAVKEKNVNDTVRAEYLTAIAALEKNL